MALSIKNEEAERLAREVAAQTGETLTQAIIESLEFRLERLKGRRTAPNLEDDILAISTRCSLLKDLDTRHSDEILGYTASGTFD
ncbi:MAG: PSK operon transcription factor [Acidobacteria bacterium]|nr:MAG: PSK operon transcription factor [Acidobacteriota bacterium]